MDNKINKPDCKLIGEDGNIFNLMAKSALQATLKTSRICERTTELSQFILHSVLKQTL